jgi:hypothetical protein
LKNQAVSLQAFAPQVSSNTAYVINRTLNKDPDQRYQSYDELIEHLEYALNELQAGRGKVEEKRVVLETVAEKKALGWLTFVMIGVLLAVIGAGVVFRDKLFSSADQQAEVKDGSSLLKKSVDDLAGGKPDDAVTALTALTTQKPPQPWLNWADLLLGLSQYASGHRSEANDSFQRIESRGPFSKKDADLPLANFFVETAKQMNSEHPIDPKAVQPGSGSSFEPAAYLLYGLKDWEVGDVDEAAVLFGRFRGAQFLGTDAWLEGLKPMATDYIEEYTSYHMAADGWKAAKTLEQKRTAVKALKAVQGKLAPRAQELATQAAADVAKIEKGRADMLAQGKVPDGRYKLTNRKNGKTIDVEGHSHDDGHRVHLFGYSNGGNQQWNISAQGGGYYLLVNAESGKALNVPKAQTDDDVALQQANVNKTSPAQKWKIEKTDQGFFKLTAMCSGKALASGGDLNDAPIVQTTYTGAPEQQWKLEILQ